MKKSAWAVAVLCLLASGRSEFARADRAGQTLAEEMMAKVRTVSSATFEVRYQGLKGEMIANDHMRISFARPGRYEVVRYRGGKPSSLHINDGQKLYQAEWNGSGWLCTQSEPGNLSAMDSLVALYLDRNINAFFYVGKTTPERGPEPLVRPKVEYVAGPRQQIDGVEYRMLNVKFALDGGKRARTVELLIAPDGLPVGYKQPDKWRSVWRSAGDVNSGFSPLYKEQNIDKRYVTDRWDRYLKVGDTIADYEFENDKGGKTSLSSIWTSNKATVIGVHSPGCRGCHTELAYFEYLQQQFGSQGLGVAIVTGPTDYGFKNPNTADPRPEWVYRMNRLYVDLEADGRKHGFISLPPLPPQLSITLLFDPAWQQRLDSRELVKIAATDPAQAQRKLVYMQSNFRSRYTDESGYGYTMLVDSKGKVLYVVGKLYQHTAFTPSFRNALVASGVPARDLPVINP